MILGLIPDCPLEGVSGVGNAAGTGARMALLNRGYRREIEQTVRDIERSRQLWNPSSRSISSMQWPCPTRSISSPTFELPSNCRYARRLTRGRMQPVESAGGDAAEADGVVPSASKHERAADLHCRY